jgi:hypothetical protein
MNVRYRVDLSQVERDELRASVSGGKQPVRRLKRMQILLAADAGVSDKAIEASVQTSGSTIYRTKKRFVEISLEAALSGRRTVSVSRRRRAFAVSGFLKRPVSSSDTQLN